MVFCPVTSQTGDWAQSPGEMEEKITLLLSSRGFYLCGWKDTSPEKELSGVGWSCSPLSFLSSA